MKTLVGEVVLGGTFKIDRRTYTVIKECKVPEALAADLGVVGQHIVEGARGATYLVQTFKDGGFRAIGAGGVSFSGRLEKST